MASQAHAEATTAFTTLAGETATTNLTGQDLGGMTLNPMYFRGFRILSDWHSAEERGYRPRFQCDNLQPDGE